MARGHGRPHNFFQGGQSRLFAYIFQVANADDQVCNQAGEAGNCPLPRKSHNKKISAGCGRMTTQCKCRTLTKRFTLSPKYLGVEAGNFLDVQRMSCPSFPNIYPRNVYATNILPANFLYLAIHYAFVYHVAID